MSSDIAFNKNGTFTLLNQYKMVDDWTYMFSHVTNEVYKISHLANKNVRVYRQLDGKEKILAETYRTDHVPIGPYR